MIHHCFSEVAEQIMIIIKVKMKKPNTSPRWYSIWEYFWRLLKLLYTYFSDKASSLLYRKATALKSPVHAVWSLTSPTLNNHNIQDCQTSVTSWIHTVDSCMAPQLRYPSCHTVHCTMLISHLCSWDVPMIWCPPRYFLSYLCRERTGN